mgnify:CR=1 FL=1
MPQLSLRVKLLASFILVLLPVLGLLIYGYRDAYEGRTSTTLDTQLQTAQAVTAMVDASFDEAFAIAWALANDPVVRTLDPTQVDPHLQRLAPYYPQYESIAVHDRTGNNAGDMRPWPPGVSRAQIGDRPYFRQVMATGEAVISPVLISRRTSAPAIIAAVPVRDDEGNTVGTVIAVLLLEALSARLEGVALGPEQSILLVDRTGTAAFYTALPDLPWEQRSLSDFEPVEAALEGKATKVKSFVSPLLGDTRIGAFTPTPKYGWVVGVDIPEDAALASVRAGMGDQLVGFGAVTILVLGLVLVSSRTLLQPIRRLTDTARALGRGDLTRRVDIRTGDELEDLGHTFNQMAERLERTLEELRETLHLREEFLSAAAHELKTPIASLRGYAQVLLRSEAARPSEERRALEVIERQTRRIERLVEDLLETVHPLVRPLERQTVDLAELAEEAVREATLASERHQLVLCRAGPVLVDAEPDLIRRVPPLAR